MRPRHLVTLTAVALGLPFVVAACGGGSLPSISGPSSTLSPGGSASPLSSGGSTGSTPIDLSTLGRITVKMTDSPYEDAMAVLVTISEVSVHRTGGGWESLPLESDSITCDLKQLQGPVDLLGGGLFEPGQYTQIRLTVSEAAIYFENAAAAGACMPTDDVVEPGGAKGTVTVPSGVVHLNRPFTVPEGGEVNLLLDFDGDKSITEINTNAACNGNKATCAADSVGTYRLSPVIAVVSVEETPADVTP